MLAKPMTSIIKLTAQSSKLKASCSLKLAASPSCWQRSFKAQ